MDDAQLILDNARRHLPTKVQTSEMDGMTQEEMAAFDSGYNSALERAHALLNLSAQSIRKVTELDKYRNRT